MKWILRLLGLLGVLLLVLIIAGIFLALTFDPNAYKERIEHEAAEATGRELTLTGPIELTFFPTLGLRLEDVRMANAEGFDETPFAEFAVVDVAVAAWPLLRGELEVQRIEADSVSLYLVRRADGRSNWDDLAERAEAAREDAVGNDEVVPPPSRVELDRFAIAGIAATNLRVEWNDRQAGTRMVLAPLNLNVREFRPGVETPVHLDGTLQLETEDAEPVGMDLRLNALLNVDLVGRRYTLRRIQSDVTLRLPGIDTPIPAGIEADLVLDLNADVARAERFSVHVSDLHLTGLAEVSGLGTAIPALQGTLRSNTFSPREVLVDLGLDAPATADPDALGRMALDLTAAGDLDRVTLEPLLIALDGSSLRGNGALDFTGPRPLLEFLLHGDRLDLDRYLPPEDAPAAPAEPRPEAAPDAVEQAEIPVDLPVEWMRTLDLDGRLTLETLTFLGLNLQDIDVVLRARDGEWRLEPLTAQGYEGRLETRASVNVREEVPQFVLGLNLENIAIGPLLEAMQEDESLLLGTGNLRLDVHTAGTRVEDWIARLNGDGELAFEDGAVRGINVARIIRRAEARLRGETPEDDDEPNETDFSELRGSFRIDDGVVHNQDLEANSPLLRVAGRGSADLADQTLDYRLDTTLVATIEGQRGRSLEELRGVTLPIRISGTFDEPRFRLDLEDTVRERVEDRLRREVEERLPEGLLERLMPGGSGRSPSPDAGNAGSAAPGPIDGEGEVADPDTQAAPSGSPRTRDLLEQLLERSRSPR